MNIIFLIAGLSPKVSSQDYFQQEVNYTIHVTLNDVKHELTAYETVEYINNSPDTLRFLYFHLWPNAYSNNNTPLAKQLFLTKGNQKLFDDPELRGSIDSLDFKIDKQTVEWHLLPKQPDICQIILNKPLNPGDSIEISTPFHVKIPKGVTSRLGHIGQSYQISQWFPKPAVYDQTGWHQMSYLDQGEFYSEFGNFDVTINLPDNYTVGASGNLHDAAETKRLDSLAENLDWKSTLSSKQSDFPVSSAKFKSLNYSGKQIHDFAWFADKRFHVLKGKIMLPISGKQVTTWAMFTNQQSRLWVDAIKYMNDAITYFSAKIGEYPFESYTAVQSALNAGAGMEYPGITVIGLADNSYSLDEVISHEIAHNWFYAALGSDERQYPFLDEGITTAYTDRYMKEKYPDKKLWDVILKKKKQARFFHIADMPIERLVELEWLAQARQNLDQPLNLPATDYTTVNYSQMIYNKTAICFNYLRSNLGDSLFDATVQDYYLRWAFKHPQPEDLRAAFQMHSEKDLSWFFDDLLGTTKRLDYKIIRMKNQQILVKNNGELISPLVISGIVGDSVRNQKWVDGFQGKKWIDVPSGPADEYKIDPQHVMPEIFRINNNIKQSGLFRKSDPIRTQLYLSIEDLEKRSLMYIPAVNWNRENGFMIGLAVHNGFLLSKPMEYLLMPLYSFQDNKIEGYGRIAYNFTPYDKLIRLAKFSMEGTQFAAPGNQDFYKVKFGIDINFRNRFANNQLNQKAFGSFIKASDLMQINLQQKAAMRNYLQFGYLIEKIGLFNPYQLLFSFETSRNYQKTAFEFNYRYSYYQKNQGLDIRFFAGKMYGNVPINSFYAFASGGRSGREEYLFDGTYPDRFALFPESLLARQMSVSEGSLVSPVNDFLGYSDWLISLSFSSNLPGKIGRFPLKPFVNIVLNDHGLREKYPSHIFYETGFKTGIWNFFEIYVPLLVSENIKSVSWSVKDRIRIVLKLDSFSWVKLNGTKSQ